MSRYSATVLDHFQHPRHSGVLEAPDREVTVRNPVCGDVLSLYVKLSDDRIGAVSFQAQGCPAAIAAGSMTAVLLQGARIEDLRGLSNQTVADALGGLPADKVHCSVLAEEAVTALLATL